MEEGELTSWLREQGMRIYLTHCSATKDNSLRGTGRKVTPDKLYTSKFTQSFMRRCMEVGVRWAIFSDHYGVWFSEIEREWYGDDVGDPNLVTNDKFLALLSDFDNSLRDYGEIVFYYNPGRFHPLYRRLLNETVLKDRVRMITHYWEIS
jgi:hypothetical protein